MHAKINSQSFMINIVAAFQGMHVSPAKHSYAWLPRKCYYWTDRQMDRQTDGQTDAGQSDPYVPLCFAGDTKISWPKLKFLTQMDRKKDRYRGKKDAFMKYYGPQPQQSTKTYFECKGQSQGHTVIEKALLVEHASQMWSLYHFWFKSCSKC